MCHATWPTRQTVKALANFLNNTAPLAVLIVACIVWVRLDPRASGARAALDWRPTDSEWQMSQLAMNGSTSSQILLLFLRVRARQRRIAFCQENCKDEVLSMRPEPGNTTGEADEIRGALWSTNCGRGAPPVVQCNRSTHKAGNACKTTSTASVDNPVGQLSIQLQYIMRHALSCEPASCLNMM